MPKIQSIPKRSAFYEEDTQINKEVWVNVKTAEAEISIAHRLKKCLLMCGMRVKRKLQRVENAKYGIWIAVNKMWDSAGSDNSLESKLFFKI